MTLGAICDRIGLKKTMTIVNTTYIIAFALLVSCTYVSKHSASVLGGFAFIGFSYGGVPTMNTVFANSFYGKKYFPQNLG